MRLTSAITWFLIYIVLFTECRNEDISWEDEYTESTPKLSNATLAFFRGGFSELRDTLKLSFDIMDAEWDIGLDPTQIDSPYHSTWFYVMNESSLKRFIPNRALTNFDYDLIAKTNQPGKIATYRRMLELDRELEYSCSNFYAYPILVSPNLVDEHDFIKDTVGGYYVLYDSIYSEANENSSTILVEFLQEQDDGRYLKFDWAKEFCTSYDTRIPNISTIPVGPSRRSGPVSFQRTSKTKGGITYNLISRGFQYVFSGKKFKLSFYIKDRALQNSNVLETEPLLIPAE